METVHSGSLEELGWNHWFAERLARAGDPSLVPARVSADHGALLSIQAGFGAGRAALSAALLAAGRPIAVGDWVGLRPASGALAEIGTVLERRTAIRRKVPLGESREQVLAANVDVALLAIALGADFNARRIERLLTVVHQSGAVPVVLLTKSDIHSADSAAEEVSAIAPGVPIHVLSPLTGEGVNAVRAHVVHGSTAVLLGSSGVGKSTLLNRLLGSGLQLTSDVHRTGQGRHTTSHRELFLLAGGGAVIDTPGLREIQIWAGEEALEQTFGDIDALVSQCRFSNCGHRGEPGCAVAAALTTGELDRGRWASYRKLQREVRAVQVRADNRLRAEERNLWKRRRRTSRENIAAKGR